MTTNPYKILRGLVNVTKHKYEIVSSLVKTDIESVWEDN